jgi:uncharacterized lipoprotein YddW (UPF0748 family)
MSVVKKINMPVMIVVVITGIFSCSLLKTDGESALYPRTELRGVWLRPPQNFREIPSILDKIKNAGFNAVFLETLYHGFVICPGSNFLNRPEYGGHDVLQEFIKEAHARGMTVHCWTEVFYLQVDIKKYPKLPRSVIFDEHPDWKLLTKNGEASDVSEDAHIFGDPANPALQSFLLEFYRDLIQRYNVDGINIDYIRYPAGKYDTGYTEFARKAFKNETGVDPLMFDSNSNPEMWMRWVRWRENRVTDFVARLSDLIKHNKPQIVLSAAIFPGYYIERGQHFTYQDWATWLEGNYVDAIIPMAYAPSLEGVRGEINSVIAKNKGKAFVLPVLAVPLTKKDNYGGSNHPPIQEQISMVRSMKLPGHTIFCYDWILQSANGFDAFKEVYFRRSEK